MRYFKKSIRDLNLDGKTVVLRLDLNVPIQDGVISDETRIIQSLPTLKYLISKNCKVVVLSHLGRVKTLADKQSNKKSLEPVANVLKKYLTPYKVVFLKENTGDTVRAELLKLIHKQVLVLENTRYQDVNDAGEVVKKESKNDLELGRFWASLGDVFINDAFGTAHRAHASNVGVAKAAKDSAIGFLIERELLNLAKACDTPEHPVVAVLGGAKIADKLHVIREIAKKSDKVLIGGGMAYTFFKAQGYEIGDSLLDPSMIDECKKLLEEFKDKIVLPVQGHAAERLENLPGVFLDVSDPNWKGQTGMDIGPKSIKVFCDYLDSAKTVLWNGPMGVFEFSNYQDGTKAIALKLAEITEKNKAFTLVGGGDSASAVHQFKLESKFSFISTGGGASLAYMEGAALPGIEAIADASK